jgi:hypothetical protein
LRINVAPSIWPPLSLPGLPMPQVFSRYQEYRHGKDMVIVEGTTVGTV